MAAASPLFLLEIGARRVLWPRRNERREESYWRTYRRMTVQRSRINLLAQLIHDDYRTAATYYLAAWSTERHLGTCLSEQALQRLRRLTFADEE